MVLVLKKNGSVRQCIDYHRLNDVTVENSYPLSWIDNTLNSLGSAKYFSMLDLASGYWQVGLMEGAQKSAFCTPSSALWNMCWEMSIWTM